MLTPDEIHEIRRRHQPLAHDGEFVREMCAACLTLYPCAVVRLVEMAERRGCFDPSPDAQSPGASEEPSPARSPGETSS